MKPIWVLVHARREDRPLSKRDLPAQPSSHSQIDPAVEFLNCFYVVPRGGYKSQTVRARFGLEDFAHIDPERTGGELNGPAGDLARIQRGGQALAEGIEQFNTPLLL